MTRGWGNFLLEWLIFFLGGGLVNDAKLSSQTSMNLFQREFFPFWILRTWRWDVYLTSTPCLDLRICRKGLGTFGTLDLLPKKRGVQKFPWAKKNNKRQVIFGGTWNLWADVGWYTQFSGEEGGVEGRWKVNLLKILLGSSNFGTF